MSDLLDRLKPLVLCASLFLPVSVWAASELSNSDAVIVLNRMVSAAKQNDFQGLFTHQHGDSTETFRIVHVMNHDRVEEERRESLDGPRRSTTARAIRSVFICPQNVRCLWIVASALNYSPSNCRKMLILYWLTTSLKKR